MKGRGNFVAASAFLIIMGLVAVTQIPSRWQASWKCSLSAMLEGKQALSNSWCKKAGIEPPS